MRNMGCTSPFPPLLPTLIDWNSPDRGHR
jgi:hypothetical protein